MQKLMRRYLFISFLLIVSIAPGMSQDMGDVPLVFIQDGYLFAWTGDGGTVQITEENFASDLVVSPDSQQVRFYGRIERTRAHPVMKSGKNYPLFRFVYGAMA